MEVRKIYPLDISEFAPPQVADVERDVLAWLDTLGPSKSDPLNQRPRMVKKLLAQPRLPEEPPEGALAAMANIEGMPGALSFEGMIGWPGRCYAALYAHLTAPKTKEVEVWRLEWSVKDLTGNWAPVAAHYPTKEAADDQARRLSRMAGEGAPHCIKVTGPHKQLVPAD